MITFIALDGEKNMREITVNPNHIVFVEKRYQSEKAQIYISGFGWIDLEVTYDEVKRKLGVG